MKKKAVWILLALALALFLSACALGELVVFDSPVASGGQPEASNAQAEESSSPTQTPDLPEATQKPEAASEEQAPTRDTQAAQDLIVLIGNPDDDLESVMRALSAGGKYRVSLNAPLDDAALVLFYASVVDGPMPKTRAALEARTGETIQRGAILLTALNQASDEELNGLVVTEVREMLARSLPGGEAEAWPVLRSNSPDLASQAQALLGVAASPVTIQPLATDVPYVAPRQVRLVGERQDAGRAAAIIAASGKYEVTIDEPLDHSDLVLFVISAVDGLRPNTVTEIENRLGEPFPRAAFFLVDAAQNTDVDLRNLILLEAREVLTKYLPDGQANNWSVLPSDAPDLADQLKALLAAPEQVTVLQPAP